jgi:hypothetical protein
MLYTEMVTTGALVHGDVPRHLDFNIEEHPVALQLGGSDAHELAHCARSAGSLPPSCNATGCSLASKSRWRGTSPCSSAPVVTISVYRSVRRVSRRWKYRQCRSVQSIIGATDMRQAVDFVEFSFAGMYLRAP